MRRRTPSPRPVAVDRLVQRERAAGREQCAGQPAEPVLYRRVRLLAGDVRDPATPDREQVLGGQPAGHLAVGHHHDVVGSIRAEERVDDRRGESGAQRLHRDVRRAADGEDTVDTAGPELADVFVMRSRGRSHRRSRSGRPGRVGRVPSARRSGPAWRTRAAPRRRARRPCSSLPVAKNLASASGRKSSRSAVAKMRSRVAGPARPVPLRTFEAVESDTPGLVGDIAQRRRLLHACLHR